MEISLVSAYKKAIIDWIKLYATALVICLKRMVYRAFSILGPMPPFFYFMINVILLPVLLYFAILKKFCSPVLHYLTARKQDESVRTPADNFERLPAWPFSSQFKAMTFSESTTHKVRVGYIDVGSDNPGNSTILLLHGSHTWSFMYRKMITQFYRSSYRVVALDFIGSGTSDKLTCPEAYSYGMHVQTVLQLIQELKLKNFHLIGFEWGATIAMSVAGRVPAKVASLALMRAKIPLGLLNDGTKGHIQLSKIQRAKNLLPYLNWTLLFYLFGRYESLTNIYVYGNEYIDITNTAMEAYKAPYPTKEFRAGIQKWPEFMPFYDDDLIVPEMEKVLDKMSTKWEKPFLLIESLMDNRVESETWRLVKQIPNTKIIRVLEPTNFLPESHGFSLASFLSDLYKNEYKESANDLGIKLLTPKFSPEGEMSLEDPLKAPNHDDSGVNENNQEELPEQQEVVEVPMAIQ